MPWCCGHVHRSSGALGRADQVRMHSRQRRVIPSMAFSSFSYQFLHLRPLLDEHNVAHPISAVVDLVEL